MNYAVLCDLNAIKISFSMFMDAISKLDGKVFYYKFYGYVPKKDKDFSNFIKSTGADVCVPIQNRKKVRVDIRQVIDAAIIASSKDDIDGLFLITSEIDAMYMINAIKNQNKKVVLGVLNDNSISSLANEVIYLDRMTAIACEDDNFLPYTSIKDESNSLSEIKKELNTLIKQKIKQKESIELDTHNIEVEELLKKYF